MTRIIVGTLFLLVGSCNGYRVVTQDYISMSALSGGAIAAICILSAVMFILLGFWSFKKELRATILQGNSGDTIPIITSRN